MPYPLYPDWRHGPCECVQGCQCQRNGAGPAAYTIKRAGVPMKVCTRCDLSSDTERTLLVTEDDEGGPIMDYDSLGAFVIVMSLGEKRASAEVA